MTERMRDNPPEPKLEKGNLVKLRENLPQNVVNALRPQMVPGIAYRVFYIDRHPDGNLFAWVGDADLSPKNVDDFNPELSQDDEYGIYKSVLPVAATHLKRLLD